MVPVKERSNPLICHHSPQDLHMVGQQPCKVVLDWEVKLICCDDNGPEKHHMSHLPCHGQPVSIEVWHE